MSKLWFLKGVDHFKRKFKLEGGSSTNDFWHQKTSPWVITWRCLRDPTFSRFDTIPACDTQTDGHTMMRRASAARVKTAVYTHC